MGKHAHSFLSTSLTAPEIKRQKRLANLRSLGNFQANQTTDDDNITTDDGMQYSKFKPFTSTTAAAIIALVFCLILSTLLAYYVDYMSASPFCSGSTCTGKNPEGTNCTKGAVNVGPPVEVLDNRSQRAGTLQLIQSPKCHSNWVKWSGALDGQSNHYNNPQIWQKDSNGFRAEIAEQFKYDHDSPSTWTGMIPDKGDTCYGVILLDQEGNYYNGNLSGNDCTQGMGG